MHFRDIAAFVLQHATFPTPPLVSTKFLHVPLGVGGWPLGYKIVCTISFLDFQPVFLIHQRHRQMDSQHGIARPVCTVVRTKVTNRPGLTGTVPVWSGLSQCPEGSVRDTEMSRFSANGPSWPQDGQRPTTHRPTCGTRPSLGLTGRAVIDSPACRTYDDVRCRCQFHWATYVVRRRNNLTLCLSIDRRGSVRVAYRW